MLIWCDKLLLAVAKNGGVYFLFTAINTLCVDIMAAMVLISLLVYKYTSTWFIGSAVAILISAFLFVYGAR